MQKRTVTPKKSALIAGLLQKSMELNPATALPTIAQLARQYDVAYQTMFDAVHILQERGLVHCRRGRKTVASNQPVLSSAPGGDLFLKMEQNLLRGTYRAGEAMPKVQFLVKSERVATHTAVAVFRRLSEKGLIHKQGKSWIAGPPEPAPSSSSVHVPRLSPVILFLTINERHWSDFFNTAHTIHFASSFNGETTKFGCQLELALGEKQETEMLGIPVGFDDINARIRTLGDRYRGTLVTFNRKVKDALTDWMTELAVYNKPVVYFDFNNDGEGVTPPESMLHSRYYRLHLDEDTAIRLILDDLTRKGHRVIGIPAIPPSPAFKWVEPRLERIRRAARRHSAAPEIVVSYLDEKFWEFPRINSIRQFITNFDQYLKKAKPGAPGVVNKPASLREALIDHTPSLMSLLDRKVTAMIGLNDAVERELYFWATSIGLKVPQSLSLVGMDNKAESIVFPLSTVDFGFSHLGYLAAHIFIGDVRIQPDRGRNMPGPCRLIDRGSIGAVPA